MAEHDHGRTDGGETATGGTGFRFDGSGRDGADPGAPTGDETGAGEATTPGGGDESPVPGDDTRARDERTRAALNERLAAVERAVTGTDTGPADLSDEAAREERLAGLDDRVDDLESRVADLEGGLQAVRGYVGDLRAVNRDVERRAEAALAAASEDVAGGGGRDSPADDAGRPDEPEARRRDGRDDAIGTDPPGSDGADVCAHCGRARHAAGTPGARGATAPDGDGKDDHRSTERDPAGERGESHRADRRPDDGDGEPEAARGMGADLDARADGYRPPTVATPSDDDGTPDGDGPLARLRDAL